MQICAPTPPLALSQLRAGGLEAQTSHATTVLGTTRKLRLAERQTCLDLHCVCPFDRRCRCSHVVPVFQVGTTTTVLVADLPGGQSHAQTGNDYQQVPPASGSPSRSLLLLPSDDDVAQGWTHFPDGRRVPFVLTDTARARGYQLLLYPPKEWNNAALRDRLQADVYGTTLFGLIQWPLFFHCSGLWIACGDTRRPRSGRESVSMGEE